MPQITRELLRKRAEHNEGIISTLEEISLHQEELESINEVLGMTCRKMKILYLQNNIIAKMENLFHMKDLTYLNLALNNVTRIEGLQNCEFLRKLDLTVNFIDFDTLKESIEHLADRHCLEELFMMGNPSQAQWSEEKKFEHYVIAKLPQLKHLDGTEITRSLQIIARQKLPQLEAELEVLAEETRRKKQAKARAAASNKKKKESGRVKEVVEGVAEDVEEDDDSDYNGNEITENTPEDRVKIYQELAQQKREKEERANVNAPKKRDYDVEQNEAVQSIRTKEKELEEGEVKQKNEGGWEFRWDEESKPGFVILDVAVQKHLDSSLIDVDVHPTYVSVVIKSKLLRLRLPAEVRASDSKCQRSKTTGWLHVIMPKLNPNETAVTIRADLKAKKGGAVDVAGTSKAAVEGRVKIKATSAKSIHDQMVEEARKASPANTTSTSLLDKDVGKGNVFTSLQKIAKQLPSTSETKEEKVEEVEEVEEVVTSEKEKSAVRETMVYELS